MVRLTLITLLADKRKVQGLTEEKKKNTSSIFRGWNQNHAFGIGGEVTPSDLGLEALWSLWVP